MTMAKPVLYSYYRSVAAWRVRIALAYKGIDYEYKSVKLDERRQESAEYKKLSPMAQVPTLLIDGLTLNQSLPIIEYLDETRPHNKLLPGDPAQRVRARTIAEMMNSGIHPLQNQKVSGMVARWCGDNSRQLEWTNFWLHRGMTAIEKVLQQTAGRFCVGDELSIADACLVPQVYNAHRFNLNMAEFPVTARVNEELQKVEAVRIADAFVQPDCPEEQRRK